MAYRSHDNLPPGSDSSATSSHAPSASASYTALHAPPSTVIPSLEASGWSQSDHGTSSQYQTDIHRVSPGSKGGCWTCRLRRKKCDEQREGDSCRTCKRLAIECLGWGPKRPDWMRDKAAVDAYKANIKAILTRAGRIRGQPRSSVHGTSASAPTLPSQTSTKTYDRSSSSDFNQSSTIHFDRVQYPYDSGVTESFVSHSQPQRQVVSFNDVPRDVVFDHQTQQSTQSYNRIFTSSDVIPEYYEGSVQNRRRVSDSELSFPLHPWKAQAADESEFRSSNAWRQPPGMPYVGHGALEGSAEISGMDHLGADSASGASTNLPISFGQHIYPVHGREDPMPYSKPNESLPDRGTMLSPELEKSANSWSTLTSSTPLNLARHDLDPDIMQGLDESLQQEGDQNVAFLEDEVADAAFVVCWPKKQSTPSGPPFFSQATAGSPSDFPCFNSSWHGGCILSVYDSDLADAWIDKHYDHELLVLLRKANIGGPIASMLSVQSEALVIFGSMTTHLIRMGNELSELSGFPVIMRPFEDDPSPRFKEQKHNSNSGEGLSADAGSQNMPAQTSFTGQRTHHAASAKMGPWDMQHERGMGSDDEGDPSTPRPTPPPSPRPQGRRDENNIIHSTDVSLMLLVDSENKGHFLRIITKAKFYPLPNSKDQSGHKAMIFEPSSIEGHVYLETRSSRSVEIDGAVGCMGFLAKKCNYLHTEHLISRGYDQPNVKFKLIRSNERSKGVTALFGLGGGKPTATVSYAAGKLTSTTTEIADDEVAKRWVVTHQPRYDNWDSPSSCYRSLSTAIKRWPPGDYQAPNYYDVSDIKAEYGIAVEVAQSISNAMSPVSFIYRHQIHCWVAVQSRARVRGIVVLTAHYVPDIRTEKPLWISSSPSLNLANQNLRPGNGEGDKQARDAQARNKERIEGSSASGDSDDSFVFSTATVPEEAARTSFRTSFGLFPSALSFKRRKDEEQETVPMRELVIQGRNRNDIGWNHSEQQWYHPVWPKLDSNLEASWDGSNVRWKLDWEHEDGCNG